MKCRYIVYALKYLAKCCKVADAKNNFLSSYTFTIMAIHYLQQLEQPVLPNLQEVRIFCFRFIIHLSSGPRSTTSEQPTSNHLNFRKSPFSKISRSRRSLESFFIDYSVFMLKYNCDLKLAVKSVQQQSTTNHIKDTTTFPE